MTSIDELFRSTPSSTTPGKRKFQAPDTDAHEAYKSTKLSADEDAKHHRTNGSGTVEDAPNEDDDDLEAGPSLPPDEDSDDEEGRFFGGGVTSSTQAAMAYLDQADGAESEVGEEEVYDAAWARRLAAGLERRITRNATQRAKFEGQPEKFMESEAELDAEIKGISILTDFAGLYTEFARAGGAERMVGLLAHDNADIAIATVESIAELLDEDVEVEQDQWDALVTAMLGADLINLLAQNFDRYNEASNESDTQGVYHSLAVLEALASQATVVEKAGSDDVVKYLLKRIQEQETGVSQNKQYAAEVLQVFLQDSEWLRKRTIELGAMDTLLQLLSPYRRKDPESNSLEEEYASNLFNALICLVREPEGKQAFLDGEGVELMLIMLREGKMSKSESLKILDHATVGAGQAVCERIVEAAGLKTIFGLFKKKPDRQGTENLLDILSAMLRLLPGESPERIRLLAKFAEKDYDKIDKLLEWRQRYVSELARVDADIARESAVLDPADREERADEWDLRRMDAGLFGLRTVNIVLAWLAAEDGAARKKVDTGIDAGLDSLVKGLQEQLGEVDTTVDEDLAEMLQALIDALQ